jgi:site-specific recombinase XerD
MLKLVVSCDWLGSRRSLKLWEFVSKEIANAFTSGLPGELLAPGSRFTLAEIARLFDADSPLLREDPYALAGPQNTVRARRCDWRAFSRFCAERHYTPLPAAPVVVREFLELSLLGDAPKSVATAERYLSTIAHAHKLADLPDPTKTAGVKGAYGHLTRNRPNSQPKAALRGVHVTYALNYLKSDNPAWDLRAKALLAVAYCTMARRAELVALRTDDLTLYKDTGDGVALIRNTKAGREESRYLSSDAVMWLKAWLESAQISGGGVFRRFTPRGTVGETAIAPQEVGRIIQRVGKLINAQKGSGESGWPTDHVSAHSTRIGAAHDLAASGIDLTSIMHSGGWTDPKMPRYYTRELAAGESGMARMLKARGTAE